MKSLARKVAEPAVVAAALYRELALSALRLLPRWETR
jgi:hypothetical protein